MKNLILAAAAIAAISFTSSNAMARHPHYRRVIRHHGHVPHHVVPHHAYRHVPVYSGHIHAYPSYQGHHHTYHYARPHYSSGGIGVYGGHFSLYIGF